MPETPGTSYLWDQIKIWSRRRGVPVEAVASAHTRGKIRRGESVRSDVYERIDSILGWETHSARDAAEKHLPPRPIEGDATNVAGARIEIMRTLNEAAAATPEATERALADARRMADEILRTLRSHK